MRNFINKLISVIMKKISLFLKLIISAVPTFFFLYIIGIIVIECFKSLKDPSMYMWILLLLSQVGIFLLLMYYINWAIWTKGIKRKIIMVFVMFFLCIFIALITMGPD